MTNDAWLSLAIQVPLVGIFVSFSLILVDKFLKSMDLRDSSWRDFLDRQQSTNQTAMANMATRFSDEIHMLGKEVAELRNKVTK